MKKIQLIIAIAAFGFFSTTNLNAQTEEYPLSIGFIGGYTSYSGDIGSTVFNTNNAFYGYLGGELGVYLSKRFSLMFNYMRGDIGIVNGVPGDFSGSFNGGSVLLKLRFFNDQTFFRPYLLAGIGGNMYYGERLVNSLNGVGTGGVGFDFNLSKRIVFDLRITGGYNFSSNVKNDEIPPTSVQEGDWIVLTGAGLRVQFGFDKDTDGDGIKDKKDDCPETPGLAEFNGCPDTDGDGIRDIDDDCPTEPGLVEFNGCPDTDGDGIMDKEDRCPTEAGPVELQGCPDRDGDGIPDIDDECPDVFGLAEFNGCPDTDGDGIVDKEDRCPTEPGPVELQGCPDRDGDGIPDIDDVCPDVPGIAANKGCPEVKVEYVETFRKALTGITFHVNSDKIKASSNKVLDEIAVIMNDNPHYKLYIAGYASSDGDDDLNLKLSKKRAASVEKYIEDKGVDSDRIRSEGFGEANPVADNNTREGRAKNRRVEFTVEF